MISVVIPTIASREEHLDRALRAYEETLDGIKHEIIIVSDEPTCGLAWNIGAAQSGGNYIHFSADDLEPHIGWWREAVKMADRGFLPAPRVLKQDGSLETCGNGVYEQSDGDIAAFTRIPFMSRTQWENIGPSLDCHYYTDNWISFKGRLQGYDTRVCRSYQFTHHWAQQGRGAGMTEPDRMEHDRRIYEQAQAEELAA